MPFLFAWSLIAFVPPLLVLFLAPHERRLIRENHDTVAFAKAVVKTLREGNYSRALALCKVAGHGCIFARYALTMVRLRESDAKPEVFDDLVRQADKDAVRQMSFLHAMKWRTIRLFVPFGLLMIAAGMNIVYGGVLTSAGMTGAVLTFLMALMIARLRNVIHARLMAIRPELAIVRDVILQGRPQPLAPSTSSVH